MLRLQDLVETGDPYALIHGVTGRIYGAGIQQDEDGAAYVLEATGTIVGTPFYGVTGDQHEVISLTVLVANNPDAKRGTLLRYRLPLSRLEALRAAGIPIDRV